MEIIFIRSPITKEKLQKIANERGSDFVKGVVDIAQGIMAIGGEFHADEEEMLVEQESKREDLWGINLYPQKTKEDWIVFDSLINIKPTQGNRSMSVKDSVIQGRIKIIVDALIKE